MTKTTMQRIPLPQGDISGILLPGVTHYNLVLEALSTREIDNPASLFLPGEYPDHHSFIAPLKQEEWTTFSYRWNWKNLPVEKLAFLQFYWLDSYLPGLFHLKRSFPQSDLLINVLLLFGHFRDITHAEVTMKLTPAFDLLPADIARCFYQHCDRSGKPINK